MWGKRSGTKIILSSSPSASSYLAKAECCPRPVMMDACPCAAPHHSTAVHFLVCFQVYFPFPCSGAAPDSAAGSPQAAPAQRRAAMHQHAAIGRALQLAMAF